jgi:hypothetical protein
MLPFSSQGSEEQGLMPDQENEGVTKKIREHIFFCFPDPQ